MLRSNTKSDSSVGAYWGGTLNEIGTYLFGPLAYLFKLFPQT